MEALASYGDASSSSESSRGQSRSPAPPVPPPPPPLPRRSAAPATDLPATLPPAHPSLVTPASSTTPLYVNTSYAALYGGDGSGDGGGAVALRPPGTLMPRAERNAVSGRVDALSLPADAFDTAYKAVTFAPGKRPRVGGAGGVAAAAAAAAAAGSYAGAPGGAVAGAGDSADGGRGKRPKPPLAAPLVPTCTFHLPERERLDYQGRSWIAPPPGALPADPPEPNYAPKSVVHTYDVCSRGVAAAVRLPPAGHLFLAGGLDGGISVWEAAGARRRVQSYAGHTAGVRGLAVEADGGGRRFLSVAFDKGVRLWDTETGRVVGSFGVGGPGGGGGGGGPGGSGGGRAVGITCVVWGQGGGGVAAAAGGGTAGTPAPSNGEFLVGTADGRVVQLDARAGDGVVQTYAGHMGPVNALALIDGGRRFVSAADDNSLRVWEWGIPVVIRYVADPSAAAVGALALHPGGKWVAASRADNQVMVYGAKDVFKVRKGKVFRGHMSAGYQVGLGFSPDGRWLASGDGVGRVWVWDWKSGRAVRSGVGHKGVCAGVAWGAGGGSDLLSWGWDGCVKAWA